MREIYLLLVTAAAFLSLPATAVAQAPDLGTAAAFAVFSTTGAFINIGPTGIQGDIGNNDAGGISGFPPGVVAGTIQINNATTAQAATDVNALYANLVSQTCENILGTSLGGNQTILPGYYCVTAAVTIDGTLILDAQNDDAALFIFQLGGTLATSKFSNVVLINGATRDNIYWQVGGAVTLGDSSAFRGNIVGNGAITLLQGAALAGRALTRAGAVNLHTNVITNSGDVTILPITLLSFNAACDNHHALIKWSTAMELNNDYYSIERSINGSDWQLAGQVKCAGNSNTIRNYSFADAEQSAAVTWYRLRQTDLDGKFTFSKVISLGTCTPAPTELSIGPNPGNGIFKLSFTGDKDQVHALSVYDLLGQKVYGSPHYQSIIDLSDKQEGTYFLHLQIASKVIVKKIIVKK